MEKVGVYSGTFDPIHIAHIESCLVASSALELDTVVIMVERNPSRKTNVTDYRDRLEMAKLATYEYRRINVIDVDEDNITVDSALDELDTKFASAEYWYILGSDLLDHIEHWEGFDKLIEKFKLCVVLRNNKDKLRVFAKLQSIAENHESLEYIVLPEVWTEVSSSKVREEIKKTGTSKLVHPDVLSYIKDNGLY